MRLKVTLLLLAGGALSFAAVYGTVIYVQSMSAEVDRLRDDAARIQDVVSIPVVPRDLPRGTIISPDDFSTLTVTASAIPASVLSDLAALPAAASGSYIALRDIPANSFILLTDFGVAPADGEAPQQASLDGRSFSLTPADLPMMLEQVAQNDRVDVYWTRGTAGAQLETRLLAVGLRVVELPSNNGSETPDTIDSDVDPLSTTQVLLEGRADDVARVLQARASAPESEFRLVPARADASLDMREITVSEDTLAQLPILRSNSTIVSDELTADVTDALNLTFTPNTSQPTICRLSIVRSATRSEVEVPC